MAAPFQLLLLASVALLITSLQGPNRKHCFQQYLCSRIHILCSGNVFTEPLSRNGSTSYSIFVYKLKCNVEFKDVGYAVHLSFEQQKPSGDNKMNTMLKKVSILSTSCRWHELCRSLEV
jgi:hypothetical protein